MEIPHLSQHTYNIYILGILQFLKLVKLLVILTQFEKNLTDECLHI